MGTYNASDSLGNSYEFTIAGEEPLRQSFQECRRL